MPENLSVILEFCENMKKHGVQLEYRGEGLPAISNKALTLLLKRSHERQYLDEEAKAALMAQQDFKCPLCGDAPSITDLSAYAA